MAAGEDQLEPLVGDRRLVHLVLRRLRHVEQAGLRRERPLAPDPVDRPVAGGGHQPGARVLGDAVARPALGRDRERLLGGLLGEVEVAEEADQVREDAPPLVAEDLLEDRYHSTIGRTSTAPPSRAAGIARRELDRGVEVVGLEEQVAAERLLDRDERPVGGQRLAVLHPDGGRRLGRLQLHARRDARASG